MSQAINKSKQAYVQKATMLFWEKGFHATSMREIQEHIDMRPGSIYATFGSKEGLFKEALQYYADDGLNYLNECIETSGSPLMALKQFIRNIVINSYHTAPSEMCMLVKTIAELTDSHEALLLESKRLLKVVEDAFTHLLIQAQQEGELAATKDTSRLARFLQTQVIGLRAYAKANGNENIHELVDDALACLD
jgi:TetR/AcrR family transcriptional repressor of nem operon